MSKPTPRHWTAKEMGNIGFNGEFECWILFDEDASLASVRRGASDEEYGDDDTVRANAAHIVKCINMHEELVLELKNIKELALKQYDPTHQKEPDRSMMAFNLGIIAGTCIRLLAKAEGREE
jgi:hypothetical protein